MGGNNTRNNGHKNKANNGTDNKFFLMELIIKKKHGGAII